MTYLQPIKFHVIIRDIGPGQTEIAEHPDGAMKAYASDSQARTALHAMEKGNWTVGEIFMVPPPPAPMPRLRGQALVDAEGQ